MFILPLSSESFPLCSSWNLDGLVDAVSLARVDLLACLGNLLEDRLVGESGDDLDGLVVEGNIVRVDACIWFCQLLVLSAHAQRPKVNNAYSGVFRCVEVDSTRLEELL